MSEYSEYTLVWKQYDDILDSMNGRRGPRNPPGAPVKKRKIRSLGGGVSQVGKKKIRSKTARRLELGCALNTLNEGVGDCTCEECILLDEDELSSY